MGAHRGQGGPSCKPRAQVIVDRLRELLAARRTFRQVAAVLGISITRAWELALANKLAHRRRALPPRLRRKALRLLDAGTMSRAAIARTVGASKPTVTRWAGARTRNRGPRRLRRPAKCDAGHRVVIWPCQICAAEDFIRKAGRQEKFNS